MQSAEPTERADRRSPGLQAPARQGPATVVRAAWAEVPHWQPWSVAAQPIALMAEERQDVAQVGSPLRFWAAAKDAATARRTVETRILVGISMTIGW